MEQTMYTVITRLQLPPQINAEMAMKHMEDSIKAEFEAYFARARELIKAQTGTEPSYEIFETPVIVDNKSGEVIIDEFPQG